MFVYLKGLGGEKEEVYIVENSVCNELKRFITEKYNLGEDEITLVYKGLKLFDDMTLKYYGIKPGCRIYYAIKKKRSRPNTAPDFLLQNSIYKSIEKDPSNRDEIKRGFRAASRPNRNLLHGEDQSKRAFYHKKYAHIISAKDNIAAIRSNVNYGRRNYISPKNRLSTLYIMNSRNRRDSLNKMPELRHAMNDPDYMNDLISFRSSPDRKKLESKLIDQALFKYEAIPDGQRTFYNHYSNVQKPFLDSLFDYDRYNKVFATIIPEKPEEPPTDPLPIVQEADQDDQIYQLFFGVNLNDDKKNGSANSKKARFNEGYMMIMEGIKLCNEAGVDLIYKKKPSFDALYNRELRQLERLGFTNKDKCKEALTEAKGNMYTAIKILKNDKKESEN